MSARVESIDPFAHLDEVYEIYCLALDYDADARETRQFRDETLPRHAGRDDFVFLGALERDELVGFTYGYTGRYGQWWTDRVAAAMDEAVRLEWLDPPHFEIVELHVLPHRQRRGIGTRLLEALLAAQPHDRALLTADPAKPQPIPFYRKHGWVELAHVQWSASSSPRSVLGKRL